MVVSAAALTHPAKDVIAGKIKPQKHLHKININQTLSKLNPSHTGQKLPEKSTKPGVGSAPAINRLAKSMTLYFL